MVHLKETILRNLDLLLSCNVIGEVQYKNRYNGFNGELAFYEDIVRRKGLTTRPGGVFIPLTSSSDSFYNSVYITLSTNVNDEFLYQHLCSVADLASKGAFVFSYNKTEAFEEWASLRADIEGKEFVDLPVPQSLRVFKFENGALALSSFQQFLNCTGFKFSLKKPRPIPASLKEHYLNKLVDFKLADLIELYLSRVILDGFCSLRNKRGAPLDIDLFVYSERLKRWTLVEVKEKDQSKNGCFGMDTRRIISLAKLSNAFSLPVYYVIREINNQHERRLKAWRVINFDKFIERIGAKTVLGGTGMMPTEAEVPTKLCPEHFFKVLNVE